MATYTCGKCGTHVESKCVHARSVFYTDDDMSMAGLLELRYGIERVPADDRRRTFDLRIVVHGVEQDEPTALVLGQLVNFIQNFDMAKFTCQHEFVIDAGQECMFGCCKG